jgi:hypothetical protein
MTKHIHDFNINDYSYDEPVLLSVGIRLWLDRTHITESLMRTRVVKRNDSISVIVDTVPGMIANFLYPIGNQPPASSRVRETVMNSVDDDTATIMSAHEPSRIRIISNDHAACERMILQYGFMDNTDDLAVLTDWNPLGIITDHMNMPITIDEARTNDNDDEDVTTLMVPVISSIIGIWAILGNLLTGSVSVGLIAGIIGAIGSIAFTVSKNTTRAARKCHGKGLRPLMRMSINGITVAMTSYDNTRKHEPTWFTKEWFRKRFRIDDPQDPVVYLNNNHAIFIAGTRLDDDYISYAEALYEHWRPSRSSRSFLSRHTICNQKTNGYTLSTLKIIRLKHETRNADYSYNNIGTEDDAVITDHTLIRIEALRHDVQRIMGMVNDMLPESSPELGIIISTLQSMNAKANMLTQCVPTADKPMRNLIDERIGEYESVISGLESSLAGINKIGDNDLESLHTITITLEQAAATMQSPFAVEGA